MATTQKQNKEVVVLARYIHKTDGKPNGTVSYLVRSSDGKSTYCTTVIEGQASGCSCPSRKPCYHMKGVVKLEQERKAVAEQFAAKQAPVWTVEMIRQGVLSTPVLSSTIQPISTPVVKDPSKFNLTTNRGFSLMR